MSVTHSGIPIIDLFAGPGGLGEGFSSLKDRKNKHRIFNIRLSIEKDEHAHRTLVLRSFLRQFPINHFPKEYYKYLKGKHGEDELYEILYKKHPDQHEAAKNEAWQATLGVTAETEIDTRIKDALNGQKDWVLIGGPPCQAFSNAGRSRVGGIDKDDHRVYLYKEYLRIIAAHQPAVFVMENVKGLLSAELNGEKIFPQILADLKDPSTVVGYSSSQKYRIHSLVNKEIKKDSDYLIRSEEYGIPQKRHRVILLGIREDVLTEPGILKKTNTVTLESVIGDFPPVRSGLYRSFINCENIVVEGLEKKRRKYQNIKDSFEEWEKLTNKYWLDISEKLGNGASFQVADVLPQTVGENYIKLNKKIICKDPKLHKWFIDRKLQGILQHVSRGHLTQDLKRYLFASLFTQLNNRFPRMEDYKKYGDDLLPDHASAESGKFTDRFRVQVKDQPATTVTSHISKDGHYFIHYDPIQCRSLTVREAARIQTFPDNYLFCGSRTQQFHQVGNAVPPYLAKQIAEIIVKLF